MITLKDYTETPFVIDEEELEKFALSVYNELKSLNEIRHSRVRDYIRELNGNSVIPKPDLDWQSNVKSSLFFQKMAFAYYYFRSLINRASKNLLSFYASNPQSKMPSILKKCYDLAVYKSDFFQEVSLTLFYGLLSGHLALLIDTDLEVDQFGDIEKRLLVKALHPLDFYISNDGFYYAYDVYIPLEKAYRLQKFWTIKPDKLEPYSITTSKEEVEYLVRSSRKRTFVKLTYIYGRYANNDLVSVPIKLTLLNDKTLVDVETINHADNLLPVIHTYFYASDFQLSYADLIWDYYKEDTRLMRSFIDRVLLSTATAFEINTTALDTEEDVEISPYMIFRTNSPDQAVRTFQLASIDPNALPFRQMILMETQNVSAMSEILEGKPTSKGRPTAKEVLLKSQLNAQYVNTLINRIEEEFIVKAVRKMLSVFIQAFIDDIHLILTPEEFQEINGLINQALLEDKPKYYYIVKNIYKGITIRVEGLSGVIRQKDELESLLSVLEMFSNLGALPFLNVPVIVKRIADIMQLPTEVVRIPTPEELQAMAQAKAKEQEDIKQFVQQMLSDKDILEKVASKPRDMLSYLQLAFGGNNNAGTSNS
jgi:antitoxin component of RelBE/YafQ-DinJ toxin-antitoxin module